jgi:predicted DNA-binding transcriptional regulator AlpA
MAYLREKAAAERLGVAPRSLQRWRKLGTGPAFTRIGPRLIGYREADLDAWTAGRVFASRAAELAQKVAA